MRILIVEDDPDLASVLTQVLTRQGNEVQAADRGEDALLIHQHADLILLDLGLPDIDGHTVLQRLRKVDAAPVVVMTARGDERSVVRALHGGAEDYVVKPVRLNELLARMDVVARRSRQRRRPTHTLRVGEGGVVIDIEARTVAVEERIVDLTPTEFDVLALLAHRAGSAVSREQMMDQVWGDAYLAVSRSLDVHIANLRAKLARPGLIRTIHGFGYRLSG